MRLYKDQDGENEKKVFLLAVSRGVLRCYDKQLPVEVCLENTSKGK